MEQKGGGVWGAVPVSDCFFQFRTSETRFGEGGHRIIVRVPGLIACKLPEYFYGFYEYLFLE